MALLLQTSALHDRSHPAQALKRFEQTAVSESEKIEENIEQLLAGFSLDGPLAYSVTLDVMPTVAWRQPYKGIQVRRSCLPLLALGTCQIHGQAARVQHDAGRHADGGLAAALQGHPGAPLLLALTRLGGLPNPTLPCCFGRALPVLAWLRQFQFSLSALHSYMHFMRPLLLKVACSASLRSAPPPEHTSACGQNLCCHVLVS